MFPNAILFLACLFCLATKHFVSGAAPLSLHQVAECAVGGEATVQLIGYDIDIDRKLTASITSLPSSGKLYQLSSVYSKYGYEPKLGSEITSVPTVITDPKLRVMYSRPTPDKEPNGEFGRFTYTINDGTSTSSDGTVVVVGPSKNVLASDFSTGNEDWTIEGNRVAGSKTSHEASSRGSLNHYIYGTDDSLNIVGGSDVDVWYFNAPSKFLGWQGAVYGGNLEFTMSSFSGDFSAGNLNSGTNLVELYCSKCATNTGVTIGYPMSSTSFDGSTKTFKISMKEDAGWVRDPENTLEKWTPPTKCDFIEVLSGLTSFRILGDLTTWYESISIDNVRLSKDVAKSNIPVCAQGKPDASICTCKGGFTNP